MNAFIFLVHFGDESNCNTSIFKLKDNSDHKSPSIVKKTVKHNLPLGQPVDATSAINLVIEQPIAGQVPKFRVLLRVGVMERLGTKQNFVTGTQTKEKAPQAFCVLTTADETETEKTYVLLEHGDKIPVVNTVLEKPPRLLVGDMPVVRGDVGGRTITVLRGSSCNTVAVRRNQVPGNKLTGFSSPVFLLNRTIKYLPEKEIGVKTLYFTGSLVAKCMANPLYDLVLGNIKGVRRIGDQDAEWDSDKIQCLKREKKKLEVRRRQ